MKYNFYDRSKDEPFILDLLFEQLPPRSREEAEAMLTKIAEKQDAARARRTYSEKRMARFQDISREAIQFAEEQVWNLSIEADKWYGKITFSAPCLDFAEADSVARFTYFLRSAAVIDIMADDDRTFVNVELFYALFDEPQT